MSLARLAACCIVLPLCVAHAGENFTVQPANIADEKAVFATVESREVVPARVRTGGTIVSLSVKEGDHVERGQLLATTGDEKLVLQQGSLEAQIAALNAQLVQAQADLRRAQSLSASGAVSKAQLDAATAAAGVVANNLKARMAERAVLGQQLNEGQVLAPTAGRVLNVPVTVGTVMMSGETVATLAQQDFVLRLRVPEEQARYLKAGDPIRLDGRALGAGPDAFGTISLVYPEIQDGRVTADAKIEGLGDYFVGQRVQVWIAGDKRPTTIVPGRYLLTRFGLDYARVRQADGSTLDIPVQRGRPRPQADMPDALEILAGLRPGDVLVLP